MSATEVDTNRKVRIALLHSSEGLHESERSSGQHTLTSKEAHRGASTSQHATMPGIRVSFSQKNFEYASGQSPAQLATAGQEHVLLGGLPRPTMWTRTRLDSCILHFESFCSGYIFAHGTSAHERYVFVDDVNIQGGFLYGVTWIQRYNSLSYRPPVSYQEPSSTFFSQKRKPMTMMEECHG